MAAAIRRRLGPAWHLAWRLWWQAVAARRVKDPPRRLTLSMLVHNEADRYLPGVLEHARHYIDDAVILDDASTDNTAKVCRDLFARYRIPLRLVRNAKAGFQREVTLRKQQWMLTTATGPDWMLFLDADEVPEERAKTDFRALLDQKRVTYHAFRLFDLWDEDHYREDAHWQAHRSYRPFLVRFVPGFPYGWNEMPLHCGRMPANVQWLPGSCSFLRIRHYGWATSRDRQVKYERYMAADPEGRYGSIVQYESILDREPHLVRWAE